MKKMLLCVVHRLSWQIPFLFALASLLVGTAFTQSQEGIGHDQQSSRVDVALRTDKSSYRLGDEITFDVLLTNNSRVPVYLYSFLARGESASLSLWPKDAITGKDIPQVVIADSITPPPTSKDDFIKLLPRHVYGVVIKTTLANLNVQKNGTYEFVAEYHSPIPSSRSFGFPIWSSEMGRVSSNRVTITVGN
jgi:hypothetical protein